MVGQVAITLLQDPVVVVMVSAVLILMILAAAKRIKVPFAVALVFAGFAVAQLAPYGPDMLQPFVDYKFTPEVFLYVFLPTLIFETAFNMDTRELRDNILPITTLAIPGLLISTAIIGLLISRFTHIELSAALLLGAIFSIIDHVAVGAFLKQVGAPKRLMILMEGEGVCLVRLLLLSLLTSCLGWPLWGISHQEMYYPE